MANDLMVPCIRVYVSAWGQYAIPDDIYSATQFGEEFVDSWIDGHGKQLILRAKPIPENWLFFKWLDEQEVASGKLDA